MIPFVFLIVFQQDVVPSVQFNLVKINPMISRLCVTLLLTAASQLEVYACEAAHVYLLLMMDRMLRCSAAWDST